jgi:hypothetical protein
MTITQYFPQWLRGRFQKPVPQNVKVKARGKKDRQVLPTLPDLKRAQVRLQDDDSPPGYRIQWRL